MGTIPQKGVFIVFKCCQYIHTLSSVRIIYLYSECEYSQFSQQLKNGYAGRHTSFALFWVDDCNQGSSTSVLYSLNFFHSPFYITLIVTTLYIITMYQQHNFPSFFSYHPFLLIIALGKPFKWYLVSTQS